MTSQAPQIRSKTASEQLTMCFGYRAYLEAANLDVVTGSPTVTQKLYPSLASSTELTIGTPAISTTTLIVDGEEHGIAQVVTASVSGGTAGRQYLVTCTATLDSVDTKQIKGILIIES